MGSQQGGKRLAAEFVRYGLVSGLCLGIDFSVLIALTEWLHVHYLVSSAIAYTAGLVVNYVLSVAWVFRQRAMKNPMAEFAVFAGVGLTGLGLNQLLMWAFTSGLGFPYQLSRVISAGFGYIWKYVVRKITLFRSNRTVT